MINYQHINKQSLDNKTIDQLYKDLLEHRWQFLIIETSNKKYCLTKEKSIFELQDEESFVNIANNDTYYKTTINLDKPKKELFYKKDLDLYQSYLDKYQCQMESTLYGDKYLFGSIAVRTKDNNFITTIRGKEDFLEYTIVTNVSHTTHTIEVTNKKATLNAPLLDYLFKNPKVKAIIHINHSFDDTLPYYDYAFPGTTRDSQRPNHTSFNIRYHGVIYLFDENKNLL